MYKEVFRWLKKLNIRVSKNYLRLRLESHPDYPSLLAVKDTLEELHIPCDAYQTDKTHLQKAGKPFLIHLNIGEGDLLYFNTIEEAERKIKDFDQHWNGIVMLAEKPGKIGNQDHDVYYEKDKQHARYGLMAVGFVFATLTGLAIWEQSLPGLLLLISNMTGLYFSWLIVQKELGLSNTISDKICSLATNSRCEAVLFSKGANLSKWLSWGDIGIAYFTSSLLYISLSLLSAGINTQIYFLLSLTALIFPIYSLSYQRWVVRQWCMLCVGVLVALGLNSIISLSFVSFVGVPDKIISSIFIFLLTAFLSGCFWLSLKGLIQRSIQSLYDKINYTRLKRNPSAFNGLLTSEEINPINLPRKDEAIRFGLPEAPLQIVMACNPYCAPCAMAHGAIEYLYEKYPDKIALTVRFAISSLEENNPKTKAAISITKSVLENKVDTHRVLNDWYSSMNYESFIQKYKPNGIEVSDILKQHKVWSNAVNIKGTPTLFINGRKLPELFNWKEFSEIIEIEFKS